MKKRSFLAILAFVSIALVSCKFDEHGNKDVLPAGNGHHEKGDHEGGEHDSNGHEAEHAEEGSESTANDADVAKLDESGNYIYDVGEMLSIELPNGKTLNVGKVSTENKLFDMLKNADFEVSTDKSKDWVTLDRVYFETGSDNLTATSKQQVENIATILEAFPSAEAKLGGYTDNTGTKEKNQPLSAGRAKSVLGQLVALGTTEGRLSSEGYGSEHPICPANDTPECKAQNRRVDIRIVKK